MKIAMMIAAAALVAGSVSFAAETTEHKKDEMKATESTTMTGAKKHKKVTTHEGKSAAGADVKTETTETSKVSKDGKKAATETTTTKTEEKH